MLLFKPYCLFLLLGLGLNAAYGQSKATVSTAEDMVNNILLGSGVVVGDVKFSGARYSIGIYEDSLNEIGMRDGILLTSGSAQLVQGPNNSPRTGWASNTAGDKELDAIARGATYDAAVLEFDFVTASENLVFEYVFASEEYLEYVGSKFNDVFAFFVEGPGLKKTNIAKLPDGVTPITVNTVNNELNSQYYRDNVYINTTDPFVWDVRNRKVVENKHYMKEEIPPKYNIQFDGFTAVLEARCRVIPGEVYHIKLAIADVGDGILDSGVILKGGSFRSYGDQFVDISEHFKTPVPRPAETRKMLVADQGHLTRSIPKDIRIGNIEFEFDRFDIPVEAKEVLTKVLHQWYKDQEASILITGHTDSMGSDDYNITLSQNRSEAVAHALKALGVPEDSLIIRYKGEEIPIQPNESAFGRARNRRVDLVIKY